MFKSPIYPKIKKDIIINQIKHVLEILKNYFPLYNILMTFNCIHTNIVLNKTL